MITRVVFIVCLIWIFVCVFMLTIGQLLAYEFVTEDQAEFFYGLIWLSLPVAIVLTLVESKSPVQSKPVVFVIALISFVIAGFFVLDRKLCSESRELVYIHKKDPHVRILKRYKGCGAYDSGPPDIHFFKIRTINKYLVYAVRVDIALLDKHNWVYVGN